MLECDNGDFREGWALWSEVRAERCQMCGDNIRSEPRDLNENPKAANGSLVRGTPSSCCKYGQFWNQGSLPMCLL